MINEQNVKYSFHGNGCTLICDKFELTYSIYTDRENHIATAPFEFMQYVNTYFLKDQTLISQADALQYLKMLESEGVVSRIFEFHNVYAINTRKISGNVIN